MKNAPTEDPYKLGRAIGRYLDLSIRILSGMPLPTDRSTELMAEARVKRQCIKDLVGDVCEWPLNDAKQFFYGLSSALKKGTVDAKGRVIRSSSTASVSDYILKHWNEVHGCKNDSELHELLRKKLGDYVVGDDPQTITKVRQRMNVRLARPGRPRKQTMPQ